MARKKTNWGVILGTVAVIGVAYYFLTRKRRAAGSGGGGPVGSGGGGGGFPGFGASPGGGGSGSGPLGNLSFGKGPNVVDMLRTFIANTLKQGYANASLLQSSNDYLPGLGESPDLSIPYEPLNLFPLSNVDIPGFDGSSDPGLLEETDLADQSIPYEPFDYGSFSPNDFLVTQDIPQTADLSSYGIDPSYGADTLTLEGSGTDPYQADSSSQQILDEGSYATPYGYS